MISLNTAAVMTNASESTLRRRVAEGTLPRMVEPGANGRSLVDFHAIEGDVCIPMDDEDREFLFSADAGDAAAQSDLGMQFLFHQRPKLAIYWFDLAVRQEHPEAMYWLSKCYLCGEGVAQNNELGMMWLARSAAGGHFIARSLMDFMIKKTIAAEVG